MSSVVDGILTVVYYLISMYCFVHSQNECLTSMYYMYIHGMNVLISMYCSYNTGLDNQHAFVWAIWDLTLVLYKTNVERSAIKLRRPCLFIDLFEIYFLLFIIYYLLLCFIKLLSYYYVL